MRLDDFGFARQHLTGAASDRRRDEGFLPDDARSNEADVYSKRPVKRRQDGGRSFFWPSTQEEISA